MMYCTIFVGYRVANRRETYILIEAQIVTLSKEHHLDAKEASDS